MKILKTAVLFTGGKDSTYALHLAFLQGYDIVVLASIIPLYDYSMLYHRPYPEILKLQARSMGFPIEFFYLRNKSMEENILRELIISVKEKYGVEKIVTGAVLSDFQRIRFSMIAEEYGVDVINPLWKIDQEKYLLELVENGFEFILLSINTYGLPPKFLGRVIRYEDALEIIRLARKYSFNPSFEGGEAETLVVKAPLFNNKLVVEGEIIKRGFYEYVFLIKNASLS